jgi:hypothetical protein
MDFQAQPIGHQVVSFPHVFEGAHIYRFGRKDVDGLERVAREPPIIGLKRPNKTLPEVDLAALQHPERGGAMLVDQPDLDVGKSRGISMQEIGKAAAGLTGARTAET